MAIHLAHLNPAQRADLAVKNYSRHIKTEEDFIKNDAYPTAPGRIKGALHAISCGCFRYKPLTGDRFATRFTALRQPRRNLRTIAENRLTQIENSKAYPKLKKAFDAVVHRQIAVDTQRERIVRTHLIPTARRDVTSLRAMKNEFDEKYDELLETFNTGLTGKINHHGRVTDHINDELEAPETLPPAKPAPKPPRSIVKTAIKIGATMTAAANLSETLGYSPSDTVPTILNGGRALFTTTVKAAGTALRYGATGISEGAKLKYDQNAVSSVLDRAIGAAENAYVPESVVHAVTTGIMTNSLAGAVEQRHPHVATAIRAAGTTAAIIPAVKAAAEALGMVEQPVEIVTQGQTAVQTGSTVLESVTQTLKPVTAKLSEAIANPAPVIAAAKGLASEVVNTVAPFIPPVGSVVSTVVQAAKENPIPAAVVGTALVVTAAVAAHKYGVVEPAKTAVRATLVDNSKYTIPVALVAIGAGAVFAAPAAIGAGVAFLALKAGSLIGQAQDALKA